MRAAVQPCVVAFWLLRFLPSGVLGPLLWRALRWLASRLAAETLIRDIRRVPPFRLNSTCRVQICGRKLLILVLVISLQVAAGVRFKNYFRVGVTAQIQVTFPANRRLENYRSFREVSLCVGA